MSIDQDNLMCQGRYAVLCREHFCLVPKTIQRVEKVDAEPIGTPKQVQTLPKHFQNTTKPRFSASEQGAEEGTKGFFNKLDRFWYRVGALAVRKPVAASGIS
jgi:hypothetical protein